MNHPACQCLGPTATCQRYGWMKGRKFEICQSEASEQRTKSLEAFVKLEEMVKDGIKADGYYRSCCG